MKCKNIECDNEPEGEKVYCSLTCRNIYVNKYLRDYSKISKSIKKPYLDKYENSPNFCGSCGEKISYEKRNNKYCNHSCAAKETNKDKDYSSHVLSKKGLMSLRYSNKKRDYNKKKKYYSNIKKCSNCNKRLPFNKRTQVFCNIECKTNFHNKNKTEYELYKNKTKFKFNLSNYKDEFDFSLIEKYGWYKAKNRGDNLGGVSRDHMISVKEGYRLGIDPLMLSHPANCKLMRHNDNVSKFDSCSISLDELIERIKYFDNKY